MAKFIQKPPHVAILLASPHVSHTQILRGILRYTQRHTPWTLEVRMGREGEPTSFDAASWRFDGVIAGRMQPGLEPLARRRRTPIVLMNDIGESLRPVARIKPDNGSIARMAASFFAEHGFARLAYVGANGQLDWSVARGKAFELEAMARGLSCDIFPCGGETAGDDAKRLREWLLSLPKPTGLFAAYDIRARGVLDACGEVGIGVPDEIAILGVDNDDILCETSSPTLSSIAMTTEEAGYRAAAILDEAMSSRRRTRETVLIQFAAKAVVERRSTAHDATRDELVRRCRALIEANVANHFGVADLARSLSVSRRKLEMRFRAAAGRTVGEEIVEQRIRRAKTLLAQRTMSQAQIAAVCGFTDASHMNVVFRRRCGVRPSEFRMGR